MNFRPLPAILLLLITVGFTLVQAIGHRNSKTVEVFKFPAPGDLHEGDIVFRQGRSLVSTIVLLNDRKTKYSHVGIVCLHNGSTCVVHAVPGEPDANGDEKVRCESTSGFFDPEKASSYAIVRLKDNVGDKSHIAAQKAMSYFREGLLFDKALDFRSDDKLYCTELVWKAYLAAGINITDNKFQHFGINLLSDSLILPGHILNSELIQWEYP